MSIIPQVLWFSKQMEAKLEANRYKGGWADTSEGWLYERAVGEMRELAVALHSQNPELVIKECADVANFMMMIADKQRGAMEVT